MKKITQQLYSVGLTLVLVFSVFTGVSLNTPVAEAQCTAESSTGNLTGYAIMTNVDSSKNDRIYMDSITYNQYESPQTSTPFGVTYDRQAKNKEWGGQGWAPDFGWVDFGGIDPSNTTNRQAQFVEMLVANDPNDDWGGWDENIDLSTVKYNSDPGGFVGRGGNGDYTAISDPTLDSPVGVGLVDFSNVNITKPPCDEQVNITINNWNTFQQPNCPIVDPQITWSTKNVVPGSCTAVAGTWSGSKSSSGGTEIGGDVTGPEQTFILRCERQSSPGNYIQGTAKAICGQTPSCDPTVDPTCSTIIIPEFREV